MLIQLSLSQLAYFNAAISSNVLEIFIKVLETLMNIAFSFSNMYINFTY